MNILFKNNFDTSTKHLDLILSIQNPFSTIVPVRESNSLI